MYTIKGDNMENKQTEENLTDVKAPTKQRKWWLSLIFIAGGLAGAIMQIILDNSLASPFTLGISAASAFGAAVSIFMELNLGILWLRPETTAFACALVSVALLVLTESLLIHHNAQKLKNQYFLHYQEQLKKILFLLV